MQGHRLKPLISTTISILTDANKRFDERQPSPQANKPAARGLQEARFRYVWVRARPEIRLRSAPPRRVSPPDAAALLGFTRKIAEVNPNSCAACRTWALRAPSSHALEFEGLRVDEERSQSSAKLRATARKPDIPDAKSGFGAASFRVVRIVAATVRCRVLCRSQLMKDWAMARILIADDHDVVRSGVRAILEPAGGLGGRRRGGERQGRRRKGARHAAGHRRHGLFAPDHERHRGDPPDPRPRARRRSPHLHHARHGSAGARGSGSRRARVSVEIGRAAISHRRDRKPRRSQAVLHRQGL